MVACVQEVAPASFLIELTSVSWGIDSDAGNGCLAVVTSALPPGAAPGAGRLGAAAVSPTMRLVADEVFHPIGKIQPLLIGLNLPDQVESSLMG